MEAAPSDFRRQPCWKSTDPSRSQAEFLSSVQEELQLLATGRLRAAAQTWPAVNQQHRAAEIGIEAANSFTEIQLCRALAFEPDAG